MSRTTARVAAMQMIFEKISGEPTKPNQNQNQNQTGGRCYVIKVFYESEYERCY